MENHSKPNSRKGKSASKSKVKMATLRQVIMLEVILPIMFKGPRDVFLKYKVTSLDQLTHKQVSEIKAEFDAFIDENPHRGYRRKNNFY